MTGIIFKQNELAVRQPLDMGGQSFVAFPEILRGVVFHNSVVRPL